MTQKLAIVHGGGPTAVLNASLYGAVMAAKKAGVERICGARGGLGGALRGDWIGLEALPQARLDALLYTPGSAIGTSREPMTPEEYERLAYDLRVGKFTHVVMCGGNGTMGACAALAERCAPLGIRVMGIPKTMDNDLMGTDHCPGYGSAARYIAVSVGEVCADVRSLPIHLVIVQAMGRNAGWVTAAAALAADFSDGPDLLCFPERPFEEEAFLAETQNLIDRKRCGVIVVSEGIRDARGNPVAPLVSKVGRSEYFGNTADHLQRLIQAKLRYKARSENPGLLSRASIGLVSTVDREEAALAGEEAVRRALAGETGAMVVFGREPGEGYRLRVDTVPLDGAALGERRLPDAFIGSDGRHVTEAFTRWARPLVGALPPPMAHFA